MSAKTKEFQRSSSRSRTCSRKFSISPGTLASATAIVLLVQSLLTLILRRGNMRDASRNVVLWLFFARILFLVALNFTAPLYWAAQSDATIEALRAAVRADPNDAEAHHKLGMAMASRAES